MDHEKIDIKAQDAFYMYFKTCSHPKILGMSTDEVLVSKDKLQVEKEETSKK